MEPEKLLHIARYYTNNRFSIYVFEHGTIVIGLKSIQEAKDTLKGTYDVPLNGESSPLGDFSTYDMDDGNTMIRFNCRFIIAIRTPDEISKAVSIEPSKTEVFLTKDPEVAIDQVARQQLSHGFQAREARGKDAHEVNVVASWNPYEN